MEFARALYGVEEGGGSDLLGEQHDFFFVGHRGLGCHRKWPSLVDVMVNIFFRIVAGVLGHLHLLDVVFRDSLEPSFILAVDSIPNLHVVRIIALVRQLGLAEHEPRVEPLELCHSLGLGLLDDMLVVLVDKGILVASDLDNPGRDHHRCKSGDHLHRDALLHHLLFLLCCR